MGKSCTRLLAKFLNQEEKSGDLETYCDCKEFIWESLLRVLILLQTQHIFIHQVFFLVFFSKRKKNVEIRKYEKKKKQHPNKPVAFNHNIHPVMKYNYPNQTKKYISFTKKAFLCFQIFRHFPLIIY